MAAILRVKDENGNIVSIPAIKGDKGEKGDRGLPGSGGVPNGGTTGQVLTKNSNADGDAGWKDSSGAAFSDDGSGNISVNGASANAKRFLNSLTVPGLDYKYVNPINSGTYTSPYGVYITSGTVIDYVVGLTQVGFYTAYVNRKVTDIPDAAKAANSSLRGFVCVSQIDNTASGGSTKCYAYIVLIDQNSNFYIQYIQSSTGGGWKRMYPYETAESALMEKLDKNQGTANSGKFLGIGADGIVVPTEVGGGESEWNILMDYTVTDEDVTNKVEWFKFCTENAVSAKEIYVLIDWKVISNANLIIRAWGDTEHGNNNYIANIINGFGARNGYNGLWHFKVADLSGSPIIDWEWSSSRGLNSDYSTGKYSKTGQYSLLAVPMTGVNIRPYSYAKVNGEDVEYGLLAGTRFRGWWR
nr:MAG TPA: hypothetical protein [Caudoviricetes sp.]